MLRLRFSLTILIQIISEQLSPLKLVSVIIFLWKLSVLETVDCQNNQTVFSVKRPLHNNESIRVQERYGYWEVSGCLSDMIV